MIEENSPVRVERSLGGGKYLGLHFHEHRSRKFLSTVYVDSGT